MIKRIVSITKNGLLYFFYKLTNRFLYLGWPVVFNQGIELENTETLSIGSFSNIGKDTWMRSALPGKGKGICLGENSMIGRRNFISCAKEITVGKNCIFGPNVTIVDNNHEFKDVTKPILAQGSSKPFPVSIGEDCWIGTNAVILPGTKIGRHCVVGANSVVSGTIPNNSVVTGSPARIVRTFDKKTNRWVKSKK